MSNAIIYSAEAPSPSQEERFLAFLKEKYGDDVTLRWKMSNAFPGGFRLEIGSEIYDWSVNGRFQQLSETLANIPSSNGNIIPLIKETIANWTPDAVAEEIGVVTTVGDGIATVKGLPNATYGEILLFTGGVRGMIQDLKEDSIGCILFDSGDEVFEGSSVKRTKKVAGVGVSTAMLGRVVDALGQPIDGYGPISVQEHMSIERPAPAILERQSVNTPLETGILSIDSMFPIGRGQRELIIGDRQTGKTAIAIDTILNQKGKNVICIYVAIGQKSSSVAQLVGNLSKRGAMDYTIVVAATASESAPLQYIAPYTGCAIAEFFMHQGKDVLIVYDDLSKHAVAYRSLSLLLERSPGREAYPGDVFYLHSRLLERSAHLSNELGGGSITALPICETQAGDVSAYIPTNIISITDGQIFLESDLFFSGHRPAVNVGLSVSRVGGDAQTKAMKKAAGALRLDLAQFREMEVFTQFSSDLDETTKNQILYGQGLMQILKQAQYSPMSQHQMVIVLITALAHLLVSIETKEIPTFIKLLIQHFEQEHLDICSLIDSTGKLSDEDKESIIDISKKFINEYKGTKKQN